jgi:hypothetical protein
MCKAIYEHSGYLFLIRALKIILKKREKKGTYLKNVHFLQKSRGKNMLPWQP